MMKVLYILSKMNPKELTDSIYLMKCLTIRDCTIQWVVMLAGLYWFIRFLCLLYLNISSN